jgi:hypothetical protein
MKNNNETEELWETISLIENFEERIILIFKDTKKKKPIFKILAEENPYRLFKLLGGDESEVNLCNMAFEYTYEQYISDYEIEYDTFDAANWDLEERSIEQAHDSGHWYVTGSCEINGPNDIILEFEFEFTDGVIDGIITTPYYEINHDRNGFRFD